MGNLTKKVIITIVLVSILPIAFFTYYITSIVKLGTNDNVNNIVLDKEQEVMSELALKYARHITYQLKKIENEVRVIKDYTTHLYTYQSVIGKLPKSQTYLKHSVFGFYYTPNKTDNSSLIISNITPVTAQMQKEALLTENLDMFFKRAVKNNPAVIRVYLVTAQSMQRIYPWVDFAESVKKGLIHPKFDVTSGSTPYVLSDIKHNPGQKEMWTDSYNDEKYGLIMSCYVPVYVNGRQKGVIGADIILSELFKDVVTKEFKYKGTYIFTTDKTGKVLISSKEAKGEVNNDALRKIVLQSKFGESTISEINVGGTPKLIASTSLIPPGWNLGLVNSKNDVLIASGMDITKADNSILKQRMWYIAIFLIILFMVTGIVLGKKFIAPITDLAIASKVIADGDLDYRIKSTRTDEIGQLANNLDLLVQDIKRYKTDGVEEGGKIKDQMDALTTENQQLKTEVSKSQDMVNTLQAHISKSQETVENLKWTRSESEKSLSNLEKMRLEFQSRNKELEQQLQELQKQLNESKVKFEDLQKKLQGKEEETTKLQNVQKEVDKVKEASKETISNSEKVRLEFQNRNKELEQQLQELQKQLNESKMKFEDLQKKLQGKEEEIIKLRNVQKEADKVKEVSKETTSLKESVATKESIVVKEPVITKESTVVKESVVPKEELKPEVQKPKVQTEIPKPKMNLPLVDELPVDKNVLIVDSEGGMLNIFRDIMYKLGYTIHVARDAQAALQKLTFGQYDLIIADTKFSDMSVDKFYESLYETDIVLAKCIIFFMSDKVDEKTKSFIEKTGNHYVAKSVTKEILEGLLKKT
ncbi:MAG: HAMP domain-containing protein [Candidatus Firestonebacteria bacterium]